MDRTHPADDRLIAVYFGDEETTDADRRTVRQHLLGCETCTWRYTELTAPLERLRRDAASEADEVFTSARLDAQCTKILDRLEDRAPSSRVVPFPNMAPRMGRPAIHRPSMRWVAAAAAAGLFFGVMGGRMLDVSRPRAVAPVARTAKMTATTPRLVSARPAEAESGAADDAMITEIELAVRSQRIPALEALDQMTPHIRPEAVIARSSMR